MHIYLFINHWHWWGLAALLVLGELLAPCYYFLAWGLAAAITGLAARLMPAMPGIWQLGLFVLLSLICLSVAHRLRQRRKPSTSTPDTRSSRADIADSHHKGREP